MSQIARCDWLPERARWSHLIHTYIYFIERPRKGLFSINIKINELCNAISAVNSDLTEICKWCCYNSLLLNPDKTKVLVVGEEALPAWDYPLYPASKISPKAI